MNNPFDTLERRFDQIEQRQSQILDILQNRYFEQFIDIDQYCEDTGQAKQTVYQKISENRLGHPYYKHGRNVRFKRSEVVEWMNQKAN